MSDPAAELSRPPPLLPLYPEPQPAWVWSAPDVAKARRLIAASHTRGTTVTIWTNPFQAKVARYLVSLLDGLGYRASLKKVSDPDYLSAVADSRNRAQAGFPEEALRLQTASPRAANRLWGKVDCEIVERAPWVSLETIRQIYIFAKRVDNFEYNPQFGLLLDQLWVR